MNERLPTILKLKSSKQITQLFENGTSVKSYPLLLVYKSEPLNVPFKVGFSVSKRNFKNAVKRNRVRRLMRECFRKNKYLFAKFDEAQFILMFIFIGKTLPTYDEVEKGLKKVAKKWEPHQ